MKEILLKNNFNLKPSKKDDRDYLGKDLPLKSIVLNKKEFYAGGKEGYTIYDQGQTEQCVGYSGASLVENALYKETGKNKRFAPEFIYGNRFDEDDKEYYGEGYYIRKALKDLRRDGVCFYEDFPRVKTYKEAMEAFENIAQDIRDCARKYRIDYYYRLDCDDPEEIVNTLETFNSPIWTGMFIYENIKDSYETGIIPNAKLTTKLLGGHAVLIKGYKKINGVYHYIIHNSWGIDYGDYGDFYIPFDNNIIFETWFAMDYIPKEIKFTINESTYIVNNKQKEMDTKPVIKNDRAYVPLRFALEELNATVEWIQNITTAIIKRGSKEYYFDIDFDENNNQIAYSQNSFHDSMALRNIYYEDDIIRRSLTYHYLDDNNRIMIPARKIFEHIANANVTWDEENKQVIIRNY